MSRQSSSSGHTIDCDETAIAFETASRHSSVGSFDLSHYNSEASSDDDEIQESPSPSGDEGSDHGAPKFVANDVVTRESSRSTSVWWR
jgi:hypothetical protein